MGGGTPSCRALGVALFNEAKADGKKSILIGCEGSLLSVSRHAGSNRVDLKGHYEKGLEDAAKVVTTAIMMRKNAIREAWGGLTAKPAMIPVDQLITLFVGPPGIYLDSASGENTIRNSGPFRAEALTYLQGFASCFPFRFRQVA